MGLSGTSFRHLEVGIGSAGAARDIEGMLGGGVGGDTYFASSVLGGSGNDGKSWREPKATLATGLALMTANQGDKLYLMPGHNENIGNAQIDLDVAGVEILGLGHGSARPRFDFDHANASINVGASGIVIKNIALLPSAAAVLIGIDIEAGFTDTLIEDVEVLPGEAGDGTDECTIGIALKAGCTRTVIRRFKERQHASAGGTIAGIQLTGQSDDVRIENCDIHIIGAGVLAPINGITTLSLNFRCFNNILETDAEPCIEMLTGTVGIIGNNWCFTDLATIDAAIVADGCANFDNLYVEVAPEAGAGIGTLSIDD